MQITREIHKQLNKSFFSFGIISVKCFFQDTEMKKSSQHLANIFFFELNLFRAVAILKMCSPKELKEGLYIKMHRRRPMKYHLEVDLHCSIPKVTK